MRRLALILSFFAATFAASAATTNYFCVVCGKGPLSGRIWICKWGAICDNCAKLENRCSLCNLPIRDGDGHVKTGDGRLICRFEKTNAVLDAKVAKEIFAETERQLFELCGTGFRLKFPEVTVNVFDVDYWTEQGRGNGLHKFGFSCTRKTAKGDCTHEVVLLSGRLRTELAATAAHEYTHLWINENLAPDRKLEQDTLEAVCELLAYLLMGVEKQEDQQKRILENTYTHGKIKNIVAIAQQRGIGFILNWVKTGTTTNLEAALTSPPAASARPVVAASPLPARLIFTGVSSVGTNWLAVVNGVTFAPGDKNFIRLRNRTATVVCREIHSDKVLLESNNVPLLLELEEKGR